MTENMRQVLIVAVLLAAAVPSNAEIAIWGSGTQSCGKWTANSKDRNENHLTDLSWLGGFMSGISYVLSPKERYPDMAAMTSWIDNYCAANPLDDISIAAAKLHQEIMNRAKR